MAERELLTKRIASTQRACDATQKAFESLLSQAEKVKQKVSLPLSIVTASGTKNGGPMSEVMGSLAGNLKGGLLRRCTGSCVH